MTILEMNSYNTQQQLDEIKTAIKIQQQDEENPLKILNNYHHVHHYVLTHLTFWILIIVITVGYCMIRKRKSHQSRQIPIQLMPLEVPKDFSSSSAPQNVQSYN